MARLFGGDRNAIGRQIRINVRNHEVVGVTPPDFLFFDPEVRLWTPIAFTPEQKTAHHSNNWMNVGRLKQGATVAQVQAEVDAHNILRAPSWNTFYSRRLSLASS